VRQAIASYGLGGDFGSSRLDRFIERIGRALLPSHYATALGNMFRRKARLFLTQLVLITAGAMFIMVMSLSSSITATLNSEFGRRHYDATVNFEGNQRVDRAVSLAQSVEGVEQVYVIPVYTVSILKGGQRAQEAGLGAYIKGMPVEESLYQPLVVEGRWLQPGDGRKIVIAKETADRNQIKVGDTVSLKIGEQTDDWQVIGLYKLVFGGGFSVAEVFAPQDVVFEVTKKYNVGSIMFVRFQPGRVVNGKLIMQRLNEKFTEEGIRTNPSSQATMDVPTLIKRVFEGRGAKVSYIQTVAENRQSAESQFAIFVGMLMALAVIVAIVGGIGLMGSLSISVVERTKEIGVMRAVGARSPTIMRMFMMEGVLQGLLSWLVAVPISFAAGRYAAQTLGQVMFSANLDYAYNYVAVLIWLVVIVVIAALASILPSRNATRISVRDSLAYA
jgi:putative ABC transport system permease protein